MKAPIDPQDEQVLLRVTQFDKVGSILFFLIPLIILLVVGKSFAVYILYLWQALSLLYIVAYRMLVSKLSTKALQLNVRRGWGYNRFYRMSWAYLVLSIIIMVGYRIISH
ncbi:hypothetical protein AB7W88_09940 [Providencia vermicola]|uniref:Uncharacterized protein n=2 Tax=Providencia TaxID=586 RepID=A0AAI9MVQ4_PROST|nr:MULTISPECIES: hypothetical protein [Providencia]ELR5043647.1 hypothetical protein [Providencia rettgeri]MTB40031.1 hypothetical protein [Providencia sp. wls1949]MTC09456.1 hypothetical protein [Providencia sp. wls1948]WBA57345.1 hypothetical protein O7C57_01720 [Providencia sp. 21OH12SH02B-Prov]ELR5034360.1 hypothetical protein [Providencia stuartii]